MSRSYKKYKIKGVFRRPKGRKQAIINNARKGSIPPDPWDDVDYSRDCRTPWRVARKMVKEGANEKRIIRTLKNKFKLDNRSANYIVNIIFKYYQPYWRN